MQKEQLPLARIYVCVNEKPAPKVACLVGEGEKCVLWLKEQITQKGLKDKVWVTRTKCQGYCAPEGTVVTFEPIHEQYSSVKFEDLPSLLENFLKHL